MTKPVFVKNCMIGEGIPKICVPITGKTREQILSQAEETVRAGADMAAVSMHKSGGSLTQSSLLLAGERMNPAKSGRTRFTA